MFRCCSIRGDKESTPLEQLTRRSQCDQTTGACIVSGLTVRFSHYPNFQGRSCQVGARVTAEGVQSKPELSGERVEVLR